MQPACRAECDHRNLQEAAWRETMEIQGEVIAPEKTPVNVPGSGWAPRILEYIAQNGNAVKKAS
jgi:hypothetical protein